jgi:hypothetical protein
VIASKLAARVRFQPAASSASTVSWRSTSSSTIAPDEKSTITPLPRAAVTASCG